MSYDGWLMMDTGGPEVATVAELGNCTSNVSPMWRKALAVAGEDIRLSETEGRVAADVLPLLRRAVEHMRDHAAEYTCMNPSNGWGDYDGALKYLANVARQCELHPRAYLHWWV